MYFSCICLLFAHGLPWPGPGVTLLQASFRQAVTSTMQASQKGFKKQNVPKLLVSCRILVSS